MKRQKPHILVVGSFVMDLIVSTTLFPGSGETVIGCDFKTAPGGKGANQAIQASRLGAHVTMVGKVGKDDFGRALLSSAANAGLDISHVVEEPSVPSAIGNIILEVQPGKKSKNRIIVVPGANMAITPEDISFLKEDIKHFDMVMLQLEIPMNINELVARYAHDAGVPVMLNSAPSAPLSPDFLACLSYISPNEYEAADITGIPIRKENGQLHTEDVQANIVALQKKGISHVLITLGSNGAAFGSTESNDYIVSPCIDVVEVKDPTAAGDSFVGAFCTAVCAGLSHRDALEFANYAATVTVSRMGAQPSLPILAEVLDLMEREGASCTAAVRSHLL